MQWLPYAFAIPLALAHPAHAANYTESIPVLGPGELPPIGSVLREQIVDESGSVDRVFKYAGQNWRCLGADGNANNYKNYPGIALYNLGQLGEHHGGYITPLHLESYPHLAQVIAGKPFDWPVCSEQGGECNHIFWESRFPYYAPMFVHENDVLAWVVIANGKNCTGTDEYAVAPDGTKSLVNTGGELVLGIHVRD